MTTTTNTTMTAAGKALMTAIGNWTGSFFDGGIVAGNGSGIWHDNLTDEAAGLPGVPKTAKGVAGVVRRLAEQGYLDVSDAGQDGVWVSLTEQGAATATALGQHADEEPTQKAAQPAKAAGAAKASPKPQKAAQPKARKAKPAESVKVEAVQFYRLRKSGTARHLPVLAAGSAERAQAKALAARVSKGESVTAIAQALGASVSTVRRQVAALAFTERVDAGEFAALVKKATDGKVIFPANTKDEA